MKKLKPILKFENKDKEVLIKLHDRVKISTKRRE